MSARHRNSDDFDYYFKFMYSEVGRFVNKYIRIFLPCDICFFFFSFKEPIFCECIHKKNH